MQGSCECGTSSKDTVGLTINPLPYLVDVLLKLYYDGILVNYKGKEFRYFRRKSFTIKPISSIELQSLFSKMGEMFCKNTSEFIICKEDVCFEIEIKKGTYYKVVVVDIYSVTIDSQNEVIKLFELSLQDILESGRCVNIHWYYKDTSDNSINYFNVPELLDDAIFDTSYPYVKGGVDNYIQSYLNSNESVLILIGPPGSGKTRFIRRILYNITKREMEKERLSIVLYTNETSVLTNDQIFIDFMGDEFCRALVLEDIDFQLNSRKEDNPTMYKILGASDGLIRAFNKKIIISTNLPNTSSIDNALCRPGRCFDTLYTRYLSFEESLNFLAWSNDDILRLLGNHDYSLAELYKLSTTGILDVKSNKKVGF